MQNEIPEDRSYKNNPLYNFIHPQTHTSRQIESSKKIVEILSNPGLSEQEKRDGVFLVLTNN